MGHLESAAIPLDSLLFNSSNIVKTQSKNAKLISLSTSSCGSKEFTETRIKITKDLINQKDIRILFFEGDLLLFHHLNLALQSPTKTPIKIETIFDNQSEYNTIEFQEFVHFLQDFNLNNPKKIAVVGLDKYSKGRSQKEVINYFKKTCRQTKFVIDMNQSTETLKGIPEDIYRNGSLYDLKTSIAPLLACLNTHLLRDSRCEFIDFIYKTNSYLDDHEIDIQIDYYKETCLGGSNASRVYNENLFSTLSNTIQYLTTDTGEFPKSIIWGYNSVLCNSKAVLNDVEPNLGSLISESFDDSKIFKLGFLHDHGSIYAFKDYDLRKSKLVLNSAVFGSVEHILHQFAEESTFKNYGLILNSDIEAFKRPLKGRFVGDRYSSNNQVSEYVECNIQDLYSMVIFFDESHSMNK